MKGAFIVVAVCLLSFCTANSLHGHQPHDDIQAIALSPAYPSDGVVFCSLNHSHPFLLKSTDRGETWTPAQIGLPYGIVSSIAVSPDYVQDSVVFCGTNSSKLERGFVFKSTDGGATWHESDTGLGSAKITCLAISPDYASDQTVFAGTTSKGIFRSSDGGLNWVKLIPSASSLGINVIAVSEDFTNDRTLFAATTKGLYKSTDGGDTWVNPISTGYTGEIDALALSPNFGHDQIVFIGVWGYGIYASPNGGVGWVGRNNGLLERFVTDVTLSPNFSNDHVVFATTKRGIFRSADNGASWVVKMDGLDGKSSQTKVHYLGIEISPAFAGDLTVFLASFEGVHRSENAGGLWRHMDTFSQKILRDLVVSPDYINDGTVFAGSYGGGVYRSEDGGGSWMTVDTGLSNMFIEPFVISPDYAVDRTVFAGVPKFVARSTTGGEAWADVEVAPTGFTFTRRLAISPDFAVDRTLFVGDGEYGDHPIYKSTDGGDTYSPLSAPFKTPRCLTVSPFYASDQTVFAGATSGVFRSVDGGVQWDRVGLDGKKVFTVAFSTAFDVDATVFAGTQDHGVYKSTDGGDTWLEVNTGIPEFITIETLGVSPEYAIDQTVFAGTRCRGVFKTTDGGAGWSCTGLAGDFVCSLAVSPAFGTDLTVFVGGWEGVYRSLDAGVTWERVLNIRRYDDKSEFIVYRGFWTQINDPFSSGTSFKHSDVAGDVASLTFNGTSIKWIGAKSQWGGIADVKIDGVFEIQVDLYEAQTSWQEVLFEKTGMGPGPHTIEIEVTGTNNPPSVGTVVTLDAFEMEY